MPSFISPSESHYSRFSGAQKWRMLGMSGSALGCGLLAASEVLGPA
jgi:hypothetical protein